MGYLTYVGGILVERDLWIENYDKSKIGSFFAHIACVTAVLKNNRSTHYFSKPAIKMRLGSQTWIDQSFVIWHKFYPKIIWELKIIILKPKKSYKSNPLNSITSMIASRSYGRLTFYNFKKFIFSEKNISVKNKFTIFLIAILPKKIVRFCYIFLFFYLGKIILRISVLN